MMTESENLKILVQHRSVSKLVSQGGTGSRDFKKAYELEQRSDRAMGKLEMFRAKVKQLQLK